MTDIEIIQYLYERLMAGDAPSIFAKYDPEAEFRLAEGHPYQRDGAPWFGHDAIAKNFFMRGRGEWENWRMIVDEIIAANGSVIVEGRYTGTYVPTGRPLNAQVCHVWTLADGKVKRFHQYINTAHLHEVMLK